MEFHMNNANTHLANAIGNPRAMMVKLFNTTATHRTMLCAKWPDNLTKKKKEKYNILKQI